MKEENKRMTHDKTGTRNQRQMNPALPKFEKYAN
jgi:hypothetical protein